MSKLEDVLLEFGFEFLPNATLSEETDGRVRITTDKGHGGMQFHCFPPFRLPLGITKKFGHASKRIVVLTYLGKAFLLRKGLSNEARARLTALGVTFRHHEAVPRQAP